MAANGDLKNGLKVNTLNSIRFNDYLHWNFDFQNF
jgi:hypothetical protein